MPTYSYRCIDCDKQFELFFYIKDYQEHPNCDKCKKNNTERMYVLDVVTQSASVRKMDSELKTIGDLARRNTERLSEDEKNHLYKKHNEYKENQSEKTLPSGMSRIKKQPKIKWPGSSGIKKRRNLKK